MSLVCPECSFETNASISTCPVCTTELSGDLDDDKASSNTLWQNLALIGTFGGFLLGVSLGIFTSTPRSENLQASAAEQHLSEQEAQSLRADWRMANEVFRVWVESNTHLGLVGWREDNDYVLFEMRRPPEGRRGVWDSLNQEQRREAMEMLGVAYTSHLMNAGQIDRIPAGMHPPFGLIYEDATRPTALREQDGQIRIAPER